MLNAKERPTLDETLAEELTPLPLDDVLALAAAGAQLLDTRASADFAGAHLRGSMNIGLDGSYATWAGTLLDHERPIVLIVEPGREKESAVRLARIGFDNVAGYLDGGMLALESRPELVERIERIDGGDARRAARGRRAAVRARRADGGRARGARRRREREHPALAPARAARRAAARPARSSCTARAATARRSPPA